MTDAQIAKTILFHRNGHSQFVLDGQLRESLGGDGYARALHIGWLQPDHETGMLAITHDQTRIETMRSLSESEKPNIGDAVTVAADGNTFQGSVAKVNGDGTYTLSFSDGKKPQITRSYTADELRVLGTVPTTDPAHPQQVPGTSQGSPVRPIVSTSPVVP